MLGYDRNVGPTTKVKSASGEITQLHSFAAKHGRLNFRDIHLRFSRQMSGNAVEAAGFVPLEQVVNRPLAGVVSGQRKAPVLEMVVQISQILGRGLGALIGMQALIERTYS